MIVEPADLTEAERAVDTATHEKDSESVYFELIPSFWKVDLRPIRFGIFQQLFSKQIFSQL